MIHKLNNDIKTHIIYKKKIMITKLNKNELLLIKILLQLNIISFIKKINKYTNTYIIKINCNNIPFKNIKNLYRPSQKLSISLDQLKKLSFTTKNILILSTNKGFITNYQAIKYKTSGILVLKLFN